MNLHGRMRIAWLAFFCLLFAAVAPAVEGKGETSVAPSSGSLAWQLEELFKWLTLTRDLVPREKGCDGPCYILTSLQLNGSAAANSFSFTARGHVLADRPVLVPLLGRPEQVILRKVTLNGQPAVIGFSDDHYYVRTAERQFSVSGEMTLTRESSFLVPGPVTLFAADIAGGRVAEGNLLPGISQMALHIERAAAAQRAQEVEPFFKLSRAYRVQKEITFEYRVMLQSPQEMTSVSLPLKLGETVLAVDGFRGWKQERDRLLVPVAGRSAGFTVSGRMNELASITPDERSAYEWVLVEADPEHRLMVKTTARQIDSSESPIPRSLTQSKLFLLSRGQRLDTEVRELATREALAMIVSSHARIAVWTNEGDLVTQDDIEYQNSGLDFMPFKGDGRILYLDADRAPQKILGQDDRKDEILIPLEKGTHTVRMQSIGKARKGFLLGVLPIPFPDYPLTISRASVEVDTPDGIVPLWLSGGRGYSSEIGWNLLAVLALSLGLSWIVFKQWKRRIAATLFLFGLYILSDMIYIVLLALLIFSALIVSLFRRVKHWRKWLLATLLTLTIAAATVAAVYSFSRNYRIERTMDYETAVSGSGGVGAAYSNPELRRQVNQMQTSSIEYRELEEKRLESEQRLGQVAREADFSAAQPYSGVTIAEGVKPVPIPLPFNQDNLFRFWVHKSLVRPEQPFQPHLVYLTRAGAFILILFWLSCLGFLVWGSRKFLLERKDKISRFLQQRIDAKPPNGD